MIFEKIALKVLMITNLKKIENQVYFKIVKYKTKRIQEILLKQWQQ